jgi:hypothetical protein
MYLSVILTIFVVLQIITLVLVYKWWKKYGRTLFKSFTQMKGMSPGGFNPSQMPDISKIPNMGQIMKQLENMTKNMGKFK